MSRSPKRNESEANEPQTQQEGDNQQRYPNSRWNQRAPYAPRRTRMTIKHKIAAQKACPDPTVAPRSEPGPW
eukprot:scaffold86373_cov43-Tisochrysis_lutea.AAC.1